MTPTNVLLQQVVELIAADPTTLAPAALALHVHLAKVAFTPTPVLVVGDLTESDFNGAAAKSATVGAAQVFSDPVTLQRIVQLSAPVGGWTWEAADGTLLPQSVFGIYVTDNADAILYGSFLLNAPVQILAQGQGLAIPWVRFAFPPGLIV